MKPWWNMWWIRIAGPNLGGICNDRGMGLLITQQAENSCGDSKDTQHLLRDPKKEGTLSLSHMYLFEHICTTHLRFWAQLSQKKGPPKVSKVPKVWFQQTKWDQMSLLENGVYPKGKLFFSHMFVHFCRRGSWELGSLWACCGPSAKVAPPLVVGWNDLGQGKPTPKGIRFPSSHFIPIKPSGSIA